MFLLQDVDIISSTEGFLGELNAVHMGGRRAIRQEALRASDKVHLRYCDGCPTYL